MEPHDGEMEATAPSLIPLPDLPMVVALVVLVLSVLYAIVFGQVLHVSLLEQIFAVGPHPPRYAPHVHYHHPLEWLLIVAPLAIGLVGVVGSLGYLSRRVGRLRRDSLETGSAGEG